MARKRNQELSSTDRKLARVLAFVWISGGILCVLSLFVLGSKSIAAALVSPFAIWYGYVWTRVAALGRRVDFNECWPLSRK